MKSQIVRMIIEAVANGQDPGLIFDHLSRDDVCAEAVWYGIIKAVDVPEAIIAEYADMIPMPHTMIMFGDEILNFAPPLPGEGFITYNENITRLKMARARAASASRQRVFGE